MKWYVTLFCITGIIELVAGVLMLSQRRRHRDRSRLLIAIFFLLTAVVVAVTMGLMLSGRYVKGDHILGTGAILTGFALFFLLLLYPLEVLRPNWINPRRLLALISPWLFFTLLLLALLPFGQTQLHSPAEILPNIYHSDVLLRVLLSLIFIPYGLWLIFIRYNWRNPFKTQIPWKYKGRWDWEMGVGAGAGVYFPPYLLGYAGAAGHVGVSYDFWFPLQLSVDWRPVLGVEFGDRGDYAPVGFYTRGFYGVTIGVRYRF
ncbi:MAG: hypothetical protein MR809_02055 [Rikenellaceae bacterium]|nr:hypothetical protein [Rikenellaceae bacterium]